MTPAARLVLVLSAAIAVELTTAGASWALPPWYCVAEGTVPSGARLYPGPHGTGPSRSVASSRAMDGCHAKRAKGCFVTACSKLVDGRYEEQH